MEMVRKIRQWLRGNPPQWFVAKFRDGTVVEVREYGVFSISPNGKRGLTHTSDGREFEFDVDRDLVEVTPLTGQRGRIAG